MIIHDCKAVFVHIPKTAGVSITHMIMSSIIGRDTSGEIGQMSRELKLRFELRGPQKHKQGKFFVRDGDITQEQWNSYFKFALIRNPWDRAVSEFHWRHTLTKRRPSKDFAEFLNYCERRIKGIDQDIYSPHAQPQATFVTNNKGKLILDKLYRFEELPKAVESIGEKLMLPLKLTKHNTSKHKHYSEYYNEQTKLKVANLYKQDIEMFGYDF